MTAPRIDDDLLALALQPLRSRTWDGAGHRRSLRAELANGTHAEHPRSRAKAAIVCAGLVLVLAAAAGTAPWLLRLFSVEVVDVQRDADGNVERITLRTEDATVLELQPLRRGREFTESVAVVVPCVGGGDLRLGVLRDDDLDLLPTFVSAPNASSPEPDPGERFAVRQVPCAWRVAREPSRLVLVGAAGRRIELPRIPTPQGTLPRYGDERGLVEILDP